MVGLTVRNLTRHERERLPAYWTAEVVNGDTVVALTRERGSWLTADFLREAKPLVAAMLQREVGRLERSRGGS